MATAATAKPAGSARKPSGQAAGARELTAQATRERILKAAIKVFAKSGFAGGRVEQISRAAKSYDRMIYYYFGSKEKLFIAALEEIYRRFCAAEAQIDLDLAQPAQALRTLVLFTWNYYQKHPEFITLLNSENLHRGRHVSKSMRAREYSATAISLLEGVLKSGIRTQVFRSDVDARDIYLTIASLSYFYLSNRFTLTAFLGENLEAPVALAHWEEFITDAVLRVVAAPAALLN
ncbi:MAG: TetR family transcriptional regulator [Rhodoferax sp.]